MPTRKGPGQSFRKGLSLPELVRMFPDDTAAEAWLVDTRWPNGVQCPNCGSWRIQSGTAHKTMPYRCRECRKRFSVRSKTVMAASNLGFQVWILAIYLLTTGIKGTSSMKLHRDLGVTQKTAWHLSHRIRAMWQAGDFLLSGPVEADETYIGGKETNKHESRKLKLGRGYYRQNARYRRQRSQHERGAGASNPARQPCHRARVCGGSCIARSHALHRRKQRLRWMAEP